MSEKEKADGAHRFVYRLSALGDVVLTTGVLDYWRRERGWSFTVGTAAHLAPLFELHPAVREVVPLRKEDLRGPAMIGRFRKLAGRYAGTGLIDLHGTLRSHVLRLLWKGDKLAYPKFSIERRSFLKSRGAGERERLNAMSVTQRYAAAVEAVPPPAAELLPKIFLSEAETRAGREAVGQACKALQEAGWSPAPGPGGTCGSGQAAGAAEGGTAGLPAFPRPVILHPYATHSRKMWPAEHWRRLMDELDRAGIFWLLVGQDAPLRPGDPRDLTNRTSLRELCAVLRQGGLMVTGDSGPMHLAAAVGLPVLALFGPTTREWGFFPAGRRDRVLELDLPCRPCSLHGGKDCPNQGECLRGIGVERVLANILEFQRSPAALG